MVEIDGGGDMGPFDHLASLFCLHPLCIVLSVMGSRVESAETPHLQGEEALESSTMRTKIVRPSIYDINNHEYC